MTIINPPERQFESQRCRTRSLIDGSIFKSSCRQQEAEQEENETWRLLMWWRTVCPPALQRLWCSAWAAEQGTKHQQQGRTLMVWCLMLERSAQGLTQDLVSVSPWLSSGLHQDPVWGSLWSRSDLLWLCSFSVSGGFVDQVQLCLGLFWTWSVGLRSISRNHIQVQYLSKYTYMIRIYTYRHTLLLTSVRGPITHITYKNVTSSVPSCSLSWNINFKCLVWNDFLYVQCKLSL